MVLQFRAQGHKCLGLRFDIAMGLGLRPLVGR